MQVLSTVCAVCGFFLSNGVGVDYEGRTTDSISIVLTAFGFLIILIISCHYSLSNVLATTIVSCFAVTSNTAWLLRLHRRSDTLESRNPPVLICLVAFSTSLSMGWVVVAFTHGTMFAQLSPTIPFPGLGGLGRSMMIMFNFSLVDCGLNILRKGRPINKLVKKE